MTKAKLLLTPSIQYQSNIKQTSDENKEKYQSEHYTLIHYQSLRTNITRIVWQTVRRITKAILGKRNQIAVLIHIIESVVICFNFSFVLNTLKEIETLYSMPTVYFMYIMFVSS